MTMDRVRESRGVPTAANTRERPTRRILFVGLSFHSYTSRIIESLRNRGFAVTYYPSEKRSFWSKSLKKFLPSVYRARLRRYHERILAAAEQSRYEFVFFLQIHYLSLEHVERLRMSQPKAKFLLYNWDSLATHDYRPYLKFLDSVFTFDRTDAENVPARYLPLFALPEYFQKSGPPAPSYDIYFVGVIGTLERFAAVRKLDDYCKEHKIRFARHLQCSPAVFLKLLRNGLFVEGLSLRSLSTGEVIRLMNDSSAVFDFPNYPQSGFTIRLIENMCAGKKVVTSNALVRNETFHSTEQFFVVNNLDFSGLQDFLRRDHEGATGQRAIACHEEFSLAHWLDTIFED